MDSAYGRRKRNMFQDISEKIVEIGPGAGANFRYYAPGTRVVAIEPNVQMHARLRQRAARHGVALELVSQPAESLPLEDDSVDTIVGTLVLCSVQNPSRVLSEVRRVLRPGGRYLFIEHVSAKTRSLVAIQQQVLRRPWRFLFAGCRVDQDALALIESNAFDSVAYEEFSIGRNWLPFSPHICGAAVK